MKKFIINIVFFVVITFIIASILDFYLSLYLRKSNARIYDCYNCIYADTMNYECLINGNSRAWVQYDPTILDSILNVNTYNLGIDGSGINRQMAKFQRFVSKHKYPKILIQNIDILSLEATSGYEREAIYPYFFVDRELIEIFDRYEDYSLGEQYLPLYRYIGFFEVVYKHLRSTDMLTKGYDGKIADYDGTIMNQMDTIVASIDKDLIDEFSTFLDQTIAKGTKVIFVYAPIIDEVHEKCSNFEDLYNIFNSLAENFDIPILDYSDIPMCYDTTYFYNATHLNKTGAELFTTKLAHDIDSIGWLK